VGIVEDRRREKEEAGRAGSREDDLKQRRVEIGQEHEGNRPDADAGAPEAEQRETRHRG
jgi:hypothetical protein